MMILGVALALCGTTLFQLSGAADPRFTKDLAEGRDDAHAVPFTITDSLYIVYKNDKERDNQLQTVIQLWRNALVPYQALSQKVKISFVKGTSVKGSLANQNAVTFKLDGASRLPIDVSAAKTSFHQVIQDMANPTVANDPSWKTIGNGGSEIKSTGGESFTITTITITITYSNSKERDGYLQQLLTLWKTVLSIYKVTNVKITFVSEKLDSSIKTGGKKWYVVTYTISGESETTVDQERAKREFDAALVKAHFTWVIIVTVGGSSSGDKTENGGSTLITDSVGLTYKNTQERDKILQQILAVWKQILISYNIINLQIIVDSETPNGGSGGSKTYIVNYHLIGTTKKKIDTSAVTSSFKSKLTTAHISGVSRVTVTITITKTVISKTSSGKA